MAPSDLLDRQQALLSELAAAPRDGMTDLTDADLLTLSRCVADQQRLVSSTAAAIAGEIARRSVPELGSAGLAQRTGHRTPQELVRVTTGSTRKEAITAVRVGELTATPAVSPWLSPLGAALRAGRLSPACAEAIRNGLGEPTVEIAASALRAAAVSLLDVAAHTDADRLYVLARQQRDILDEAGIRDRETARREARSLRFTRLPDGMARLTWLMDPETAATVGEVFDRATSPRRGGPRFVNPDDATLATAITDDTRTTEQLASDVFAHLLRAGAGADSTQLLGTGAPVVRVLVSAPSLATGTGHGHLEGHPDPISIETIERLTCGGNVSQITVDDRGQILDHGHEQRLFTKAQRTALAARDGGCMWTDCDRPPSWTEAHHIKHWAKHHGKTDLVNGILLCRHHHLLLHNNHWDITLDEHGRYWLIPPTDVDPTRSPRPLPTKSAALRQLLATG